MAFDGLRCWWFGSRLGRRLDFRDSRADVAGFHLAGVALGEFYRAQGGVVFPVPVLRFVLLVAGLVAEVLEFHDYET